MSFISSSSEKLDLSSRQICSKSRKLSNERIPMKKLKISSSSDEEKEKEKEIFFEKHFLRNEQIRQSIPILAQAFANGFFTEVNCRSLPESSLDQLAQEVFQFVEKQIPLNRSLIFNDFSAESLLNQFVNRISLGDFEENCSLSSRQGNEFHLMNIILYQTRKDQPNEHQLIVEDEKVNFGRRWTLPHQQFESLWENLEFDLPIKSQLIQYVFTVIRFDKAKIDRSIIHCNQTILLYGPPGCGKTSLCQGLAQKVSIRMKELFDRFYFYEINGGAIFSKWFSESSHNLSRIFDEILRLASDPLTFVMILIDEIESLSMCRTSSISSNEPSDMLRVVNTLLTQIDRLKSFSNILILTTSNLIEIIDQALIDRSDLVLFISPPSLKTIFHIYKDCLNQLIDKNLLRNQSEQFTEDLWNLAKLSQGFTGRTLRKLPMIAFSHIQSIDQNISTQLFLKAIQQEIQQHKNTQNYLKQFHPS